MMTGRRTCKKVVKSGGHKSVRSREKVHHRMILVRKHYLETSGEDDDLSTNENIQRTNFDTIHEKENSSGSDSTGDILHIDESSTECPCPNDDVLPGVTQSSINILEPHDKPMSSLQSPANQDSSTMPLPSGRSKQDEYNNSSYTSFEDVLKENYELKKQIQFYKTDWILKSTSLEAQASSKSDQSIDTSSTNSIKTIKNQSKRKRKEKIRRRLKLTKKQSRECKHDTDITKTCRAITKCLYPDFHLQTSMSVSRMSNQQKADIREYAKILHPDQRHIKKYILHNAIGNVFASQKQKQ